MKKRPLMLRAFLLSVPVMVLCACSAPPRDFVETGSPETVELKIRGEYTYDEVWIIVSNYVKAQFEIEAQNKEKGFLQTSWIYPTTGKLTKSYRNRLTFEFSPDRYTLNILLDAEFQKHGFLGIDSGWVKGKDDTFGQPIIDYLSGKIKRIG